jgi:membrane fusion protein, copper/silver efflux system
MNDHMHSTTQRRTNRQWALLAVAVVAAVVVVFVAILFSREKDTPSGPAPRSALAPKAVQGMQDMPGMSGTDSGTQAGSYVRLTPSQLREFGITFATVTVRALGAEIQATGVVTADESRLTSVTARSSGYAEQVHASTVGSEVRRGAPLLDLYSPEIVAAQEELLLARRADQSIAAGVPGLSTMDGSLAAAAQRRLQQLGVSDPLIADVLRSGRVRRTVTITAPRDGAIIEKNVVTGQAVSAGSTLYTLADLSRVWIDVNVREADAPVLRPGMTATIAISTSATPQLAGRVEVISPILDPTSRTVRARVAVSNVARLLRPGMYASVRLSTTQRSVLTVPTSAVINTGTRTLVFMDMGKDGLMPMDVRQGRITSEYAEILSGLSAGDRVVTSAQYLLESESNLADVMRAMITQTGSGAMQASPGMPDMPGMPGTSSSPQPARKP